MVAEPRLRQSGRQAAALAGLQPPLRTEGVSGREGTEEEEANLPPLSIQPHPTPTSQLCRCPPVFQHRCDHVRGPSLARVENGSSVVP